MLASPLFSQYVAFAVLPVTLHFFINYLKRFTTHFASLIHLQQRSLSLPSIQHFPLTFPERPSTRAESCPHIVCSLSYHDTFRLSLGDFDSS